MKKYYFLIFSILVLMNCEVETTEGTAQSVQQEIQEQEQQEISAEINLFEETSFLTLANETIDLKSYKGKKIVLNLWATWCGPCVTEMPSLEAAYQILKKDNYVFLAASNEGLTTIDGFVNRTDYSFDFLKLDENFTPFDISVLPTTFIFDSEGKVVRKIVGSMKWNSETILEELQNVK